MKVTVLMAQSGTSEDETDYDIFVVGVFVNEVIAQARQAQIEEEVERVLALPVLQNPALQCSLPGAERSIRLVEGGLDVFVPTAWDGDDGSCFGDHVKLSVETSLLSLCDALLQEDLARGLHLWTANTTLITS